MLKSKKDQVYGLVQRHDKAGHGPVCNCNGIAFPDLVDPQRDHGATGTHHISVPGTAYLRFRCSAALADDHLLHHGLACPHGIDRVSGLIGGKADH